MAIRCSRTDCEFNNRGWCELDMIHVNENKCCEEYIPKRVRKK